MTSAGVYDNSSPTTQQYCRTDQTDVLKKSPWIRVPYPGQWGTIIWSWPSTLTMLAGALSAMVRRAPRAGHGGLSNTDPGRASGLFK